MKRFIVLALLVMVMAMVFAIPASAAGPCDGDGAAYGQDHISDRATSGNIGPDGHIPGSHEGFAKCLAGTGAAGDDNGQGEHSP